MQPWISKNCSWADSGAGDRLTLYLKELALWNRRYNLTGFPEHQWMDKIVAESAGLVSAILDNRIPGRESGSWMDMGTGAGIPGLIIAAMCPDQPIYLVDSRKKRIDFLTHIVRKMALRNVTVIHDRLEKIPDSHKNLKGAVSVFFSRALADTPDLVEYADPLASVGAILISPRGGTETDCAIQFISKHGRIWSGRIVYLPVPGFDRMLKCARLMLETINDAEGVA
ncbi:16S rRNA (guanine(527)-N(7))-methyltransferase RsmG [bacterium]|nr:16S rRNA (guanine(527)-N(7))-methyltransferase RsmG [candidate division CSSED10-310 bacterium]